MIIVNFATKNKILFGKDMNHSQKISSLKYLTPAVALAVFLSLILAYGSAYTPPKAQIQRIVCYKFKEGKKQILVKKHLEAFQNLKREIPEIVAYSAGETNLSKEASETYDVMHYLTFRNKAEIEKFNQSTQYQTFEKENSSNWEKVLVIDADIK